MGISNDFQQYSAKNISEGSKILQVKFKGNFTKINGKQIKERLGRDNFIPQQSYEG